MTKEKQIPQDGFWHCEIRLKDDKGWPTSTLDLSLDYIMCYIVEPYCENREFFVGGKSIKNRSHIREIKIVYTPQKANYYKHYGDYGYVGYYSPPAIEQGEEFTSVLLDSKKFSENIHADETNNKNLTINVTQTNTQTQTTDINIFYEQVRNLQDAFHEWRSKIPDISVEDEKSLKETQDALDGLSPDATDEEKRSSLTKLSRVIRRTKNIGTSLGKAVLAVPDLVERVNKLRNLYNGVANTVGLPPL